MRYRARTRYSLPSSRLRTRGHDAVALVGDRHQLVVKAHTTGVELVGPGFPLIASGASSTAGDIASRS
jgi:hypothetical protein